MNTGNIRFKSNKVRDIILLFHDELDSIYGKDETSVFIDMLFEAFIGWDKARLLINKESTIDQSDLLRFHWALEDLEKQRPIQHIIGWTEFCGCHIEVDESTLIPRPETEEIVLKTIELYGDKPPRKVLDLCTGSGCIAIALAKAWPEAEIIAVDISDKALEKARQNAEINNVKVEFLHRDILHDELMPPSPIDLIISNPPYICDSERADIKANVLDYEPSTALFVPDGDPLLFYCRIAELSRGLLNQNRFDEKGASLSGRTLLSEKGQIVLEINERFGKETQALFNQHGFLSTLEKDFRGKERMIIAKNIQ